MTYVTDLGFNIYQIELIDGNSPYRTTVYVIKGQKTVLIETGASPSNKIIQKALEELELDPSDIDIIAVTHIHLDHAGGAGLLMNQCPNAKLLVHKKGKKHLVDPEKLIAGARQVYGKKFDSMFDPILPIDPTRIDVMEDGDELDLGNNRSLRFLDTPGHAFHHLAILDSLSHGIFSGDSVGIYYKKLNDQLGIPFCLPVSAPTQFVPEIMVQTLDRLIDLSPERIYFTHVGMSESAMVLLQQAKQWTRFFGDECVEYYKKEHSPDGLFLLMQNEINKKLGALGVPGNFTGTGHFRADIALNVQGIIVYTDRLGQKSGE
ncbi:MBL fold metallo-hydrolase [bacterium]|nr:MBL fold metallo-hydrolase [bacterium]